MGLYNKFLNIMPYHCRYCSGAFYAMERLSEEARRQELFVTEMRKEEAVIEPVWEALRMEDPIFVHGFGHGNNDTFTGDTTAPIFKSDMCDILQGRVVYLLSCLTANGLGPAIIGVGGIAYGGYNVKWTWITANVAQDPYLDWYAEGFYRGSNEFAIALIQGEPVFRAQERCIAEYNRWINIWGTERIDDALAASAIKWLIHDRDGLTVLGDTMARIVAAGAPTIMVVDVEPPPLADSGEVFPFGGMLLERETNKPLTNKTINLFVDGVLVDSTTTGGDGKWNFDVSLLSGVRRVYAQFPGDEEYAPIYTHQYTVEVGITQIIITARPPSSVDPRETFQFSGVLVSGATGIPGKPINLWQIGIETPIATTTTAKDGSWGFNVAFDVKGHYRIYTEFPGDDEYVKISTDEYTVAVGLLPIFGWKPLEKGELGSGVVRKIEGSVFECPEDGTAESISVFLQAGWRLGKVRCAIYRRDDYKLMGVTEERVFDGGRFFDWRTFIFPSPPELTANTKYILAAWASDAAVVYFDPGDYAQNLWQHIDYNDFPDPFRPLYAAPYKAAIYCSYRPTVPRLKLSIASTPINVPVTLDGSPIGNTPVERGVDEGEHTVEVPEEVTT